MRISRRSGIHFWIFVTASSLLCRPSPARAQNEAIPASSLSAQDVRDLTATVRQLQSQIQALNTQVSELRAVQQQTLEETQALRAELNRAKELLDAGTTNAERPQMALSPQASSETTSTPRTQKESTSSLDEQVAKLADNQDLLNDKVTEQSQTKVESGSKYRVRLSGIVLLNTSVTRGSVDNLDFPQIATPPETPGTSGAFSGSLRQSQIGIEAFGPDLAGARTSANVSFDFAGGFPGLPNGSAFGVVRLRTGTVRLDWQQTSIVAGQDSLFWAPLTPTTLSSLAIPALSYTGNLWSWTPQIRVEHRAKLSDTSSLLLQAGILDSLTGDVPEDAYRYPTVGEQSGQPSYAARIAWSQRMFGRDLTIGLGGNYGRQNWGYGRYVNGWAFATDVTVPLGQRFDFTGEFYRGRAVGGFGGGIGQSLLLTGPINDPSTSIRGLDSMGGWAQLKFKPRTNFEINLAYGQDDPFANELRSFPESAYYYGYLLSRNRSPFVNFIYRVRSDVLVSTEYQRLHTNTLDSTANIANQVTISLGYLF